MKTKGVGRTTTGEVRKVNEDSVLFDDRLRLYIVADGVGGLAQGDRASTLAVEVCARELNSLSTEHNLSATADDQLAAWLRQAVVQASHEVREEAIDSGWRSRDDSGDGGESGGKMATTLTVLWLVEGGRAVICHVGDSRAYHWRQGTLKQITHDHTIAEELVRAGILEPDEVSTHPYRFVLSRSVGSQDEVEPDTLVFDTQAGDRFLLCTDGLTRYLPAGAWLQDVLTSSEPATAIDTLIRHALESGGADNVTALVVVIDEATSRASSARARTGVWEKLRRLVVGTDD